MLVSDPPDHLGKTTSNWKTEIFGLLRSRDPSKVPSTGTLAERSKHKTPQEILAVGDVVVMEGVIALNKDFGAGYFYKVILEEGVVVK